MVPKPLLIAVVLTALVRLHAADSAPSSAMPGTLPGWSLELLAQAPDVQHPAAIACAPDGRIFVAEDPMDIRTERADVAEGRILCFHPDGRRTVFVDGIFAAFGLQYLDGRLYALHNPYFSVWTDAGDHGTNRVDLVRNTNPQWHALGWNDHVPANFRLGLDGRFYVSTGDKGLFGAVGADGKRFDFFGGGIFRMRPDGTALEPFSTGVRNILDVALDAEDNAFTFDNTDEHEWMGRLTHMVDGGFYGYPHDFIPRRPYTLWCLADFGAGAATAVVASLDDGLPVTYRGNLFLADFGKRNVLRVPLVPNGATWAVRGSNGPVRGVAGMADAEPLFRDPPEDFRPVGLAFTPDGRSLVVGDWQHRDVKDAHARVGRLWKLTWTGGGTPSPQPGWYVAAASGRPSGATAAELMAGLEHPSKDVRHCAQRRLSEWAGSDAGLRGALMNLASDPGRPALARIHALWASAASAGAGGGNETGAAWARLIQDSDPRVTAQAIRAAGESGRVEMAAPLIGALTSHSADLRFRAATALGRLGATAAVESLQATLADPDDWVRYAAFQALNRIGRRHPAAWPAVVAGLASPNPRVAEGTAFAVRATFDDALVAALVGFRRDAQRPSAARAAAAVLLADACRQPPAWDGGWWAYHPFRTPRPAHTVEWSGTARVREDLLRALEDGQADIRLTALGGLEAESAPAILDAVNALRARETDPAVRARALDVLSGQRDSRSRPVAVAVLTDAQADSREQAAALRAAARLGGPDLAAAVVGWMQRAKPGTELWSVAVTSAESLRATAAVPLIRRAVGTDDATTAGAIRALGRLGGEEARQELLSLLESGPIPVRSLALAELASSPLPAEIPALLSAWQHPDLRSDASLALARVPDVRALDAYLSGLESRSPEQRAAARKALETLRAEARPVLETRADGLSPRVLAELQALYRDDAEAAKGALFQTRRVAASPEEYLDYALTHAGDPARGETLFRDGTGLNCMGCHRIRGEGADVGPDLSNMGAQFGPRELAESILWPSRVVREGYQAVLVELKDGEEVAGLIKGESPEVLTLRDSAGRLRQLAKGAVVSRRQSDQSLMPDGLQAGLTLQEFADLLAFATRCRSSP